MKDLIFIIIILVVVGGAVMYIRNSKKKGIKCVGCPEGLTCANKDKCPSANDAK